VARPACLYCGAVHSPATVAALETSRAALAAEAPKREERALLVARLEGVDAGALAAAFGLSAYEAAQWARRGGYHLHRAAAPADAAAERERLGGHGVAAFTLEEAAVRADADPDPALGGGFDGAALDLRTRAGRTRLAPADLLLLVKGPIAREHVARVDRLKLVRTATLEPGFRFHLHRLAGGRPVEIDPAAFELGAARAAESSLLEIAGWMARLAEAVAVDDGFRRVPPALAPAAPAAPGRVAADETLRKAAGREPDILDNLAQFRLYSAWRGAVERLHRR
jgi:hypothetical protein